MNEQELDLVRQQSRQAMEELLAAADTAPGDIVVVGCSSSEILGERIGHGSSFETAKAVLEGLLPPLREKGLYLAAQCCEHLNRSLIVERAAVTRWEQIVSVVPQPKAGGSFATAAWQAFEAPCAVCEVSAAAGLDIGDTFIGMHLRRVVVPVRLSLSAIGSAHLTAARTRPPYVGGARAVYTADIHSQQGEGGVQP